MIPIFTQMERIDEITNLLTEMAKNFGDTDKFLELNRKFKDTVAIHKLEDALNGEVRR